MSATITIEKGTLVIKMPLSKGTPSTSGKNLVLASTGGFTEVKGSDGIRVNVTAIRKP